MLSSICVVTRFARSSESINTGRMPAYRSSQEEGTAVYVYCGRTGTWVTHSSRMAYASSDLISLQKSTQAHTCDLRMLRCLVTVLRGSPQLARISGVELCLTPEANYPELLVDRCEGELNHQGFSTTLECKRKALDVQAGRASTIITGMFALPCEKPLHNLSMRVSTRIGRATLSLDHGMDARWPL